MKKVKIVFYARNVKEKVSLWVVGWKTPKAGWYSITIPTLEKYRLQLAKPKPLEGDEEALIALCLVDLWFFKKLLSVASKSPDFATTNERTLPDQDWSQIPP